MDPTIITHPETHSILCFAHLACALVTPEQTQALQTSIERKTVRPRFPVSARNFCLEGPAKGDGGFAESDFEEDEGAAVMPVDMPAMN